MRHHPTFIVSFVSTLLIGTGGTAACADGWRYLGAVSSIERSDSVVLLRCGKSSVRIVAVADGVVRVRLGVDGDFGRDFSWAVEDLTPHGKFLSIEETDSQIVLETETLRVTVQRDPCRLTISDLEGRVLVADDPQRGMAWRASPVGGQPQVRAWQTYFGGTGIFGLGEKAGSLYKGGQAWTMWNTDAFAYKATTDPLYISVPFFLARRDNVCHGVFFDNPWRTSFDFGKLERNVMSFGAEGGELNYYVIAGPMPLDVIRRYTALTGRIELPPKWALGYHQCRFSYFPESYVREIADTFRAKKIPCDVIWFDIDYMNGYRCFTWDKTYFPDPKGLIDDLHAQGFRTIAILDPGIKTEPGYHVYDSGSDNGVWLRDVTGEPYVGRVWPGKCVFPDFTSPVVREWWSGLFPSFLASCGLDGIWNDMNEPSDFDGPNGTVPLDLVHDNEGEAAPHRACHNIYGMQMVRATKAGMERTNPGKRVFTLSRASYAGGQRYGAMWTGDNISSWPHLAMSIPMALNMGISGMPFVGPDIGGFVGGASPELFARWFQAGSLFPFMRTHTGAGNPAQEPWSYGPEVEEIARVALARRYALLPYLYTLFEEASRTGAPIMRPLWMVDPSAPHYYQNATFMLGDDIFVAPILKPGGDVVSVRPPAGAWFDVHTDLIYGGGRWHRVAGDLSMLPLFARAGAIIPGQSPIQTTAEAPDEPLILDVWPFGESSGELYEDDGETLAYRKGEFRRTRFTCRQDGEYIDFAIHTPEGSFAPPDRWPLLRLHGLRGTIESVVCSLGPDAIPEDDATAKKRYGNPRKLPTFDEIPKQNPSAFRAARETDATQVIRGIKSESGAAPKQAGEFSLDPKTNVWSVRLFKDTSQPQYVRVHLTDPHAQDAKPVTIEFDAPDEDIVSHRFISKPIADDGIARMTVRHPWDNAIRLKRLAINADKLTSMRVRISTESTTKIGIRFATEQNPANLIGGKEGFEITPDGKLHEYMVNLRELFGDRWAGTVHEFYVVLLEDVRVGETVRLDRIVFESPTESRAE